MTERAITINHSDGLHMRPARELCRMAMRFEDCSITLCFRNKEFNAKSLLSILSACVQQGDQLCLRCCGKDEALAAEQLTAFLEQSGAGKQIL